MRFVMVGGVTFTGRTAAEVVEAVRADGEQWHGKVSIDDFVSWSLANAAELGQTLVAMPGADTLEARCREYLAEVERLGLGKLDKE